MPPANGVSHITDVYITTRIDSYPVGCDELAWAFSLFGIPKAGLQLALQVVNAHPVS